MLCPNFLLKIVMSACSYRVASVSHVCHCAPHMFDDYQRTQNALIWAGLYHLLIWDMKGRFGIIIVVSILFSKIEKRKKIDTKACLASCFQNCFGKFS